MAAKAVITMALATLRDLLSEEARFLSGVSREMKALETQLKEMRCLLEDADKQRHTSKTVANWITEIKDLAYRAEDAIESYAIKISSARSSSSGRGHRLLRRFSCFSLHQIGSEISQIKTELERVTKSMQEYGIRSIIRGESDDANQLQEWKRQTYPYETFDDCFVGKEGELERLVALTLDQEERHRVVSIWGMGGIGKTTIARKVYNHVEVKRSFEAFAWVCITQQCRIRSVWEDVVKQLSPKNRDDISSLSNTELIGQLCQIQKAKRCMIVVDDVWEIHHWDGLKHGFLIQGLKSKIMLTTRKQTVANMGLAFEIGLLNVDHAWKLLKNKAYSHNNIPGFAFEEEVFEKIGKEMVHKCGYLPLVISLLGGVLSKKTSMREWEIVNGNMNAYLYKVGDIETEKEIHGVFSLSYEDLPYYLKPCFLYMGQFKEDEEIYADDLYRMWIAQGMIAHENGESTLDTAERYLSELASACIVQVDVEDALPQKKFRTCKLHDVVREQCLSMGKGEDFGVQILDYQGAGKLTTLLSSFKMRHLTIRFDREMELERDQVTIFQTPISKHIRSLKLLYDKNGEITLFPYALFDFRKFKMLRVLRFVRFKFTREKLSRGIGSLIHLRYLCLEECVLDVLPSSIRNLAYLHTLDLTNSCNIRVPNVLRKMLRLKHLLLPDYDNKVIGDYRLTLDEGVADLETLLGFNSLVHELKSITKMKNLRCFGATVYDNESLSAVVSAITNSWKNLQYCAVAVEKGCRFTDSVLMEVLTCPSIHNLTICVRLGKLLEACENQIATSKLITLSLCECEIEDDQIEMLGKLPFLRDLALLEGSFVGEEMTCHASGFCNLKWVELRGLVNLRRWRVEQGAMPIISEITINNCPRLEMIPDEFIFIVTLQILVVVGMPGLEKRVSEGGEDFDKVRHVPSIIIN